MGRNLRWLGLCFVLCFVATSFSGCSLRRMLYGHLDWVLLHQFDRFFDLDSEQKQALRKSIDETIAWYKRDRLPELIRLLKSVKEASDKQSIEPGQLDEWLLTLDQHRKDLVIKMSPQLIPLALTLNAEQLSHFEKRLLDREKKRLKVLKKSGQEFDDALADHIEDIGESFSSWLGPLRKDQEQILAESLQLNRAVLEAQMDQRRRFRSYWLAQLAAKNPDDLSRAFAAMTSQDRPELNEVDRKILDEQRKAWRRFWSLLIPSLDQKQWKKLAQFAGELSQELQEQMEREVSAQRPANL